MWRDVNADGISAAAELTNITAEEITSINLNDSAPSGRGRFREGNSILGISSFVGSGGFDREVIAVGFTTDQTQTRFVLPNDFEYDPDVFVLPNLRGRDVTCACAHHAANDNGRNVAERFVA